MAESSTGYNERDAKSILQYIYKNYGGTSAFETRGKALGIFMDCASTQHLRKEISILKTLEDGGRIQELARASSLSRTEQQKKLNVIRSDLVSNKAMDDAAVVQILQMLSEALNWKYQTFQADCAPKKAEPQPRKEEKIQDNPLRKIRRQPEPQPQPQPQPRRKPPKQNSRKKKHWLLPLLLLAAAFAAWQAMKPSQTVPSAVSSSVSASSVSASSEAASFEAVSSEAASEETVFVLPNVVGKDETTACQTLEAEGAEVSISYQYDANAATGVVIAQSPTAGTEWNGETVELVVCDKSLGMVSVPNVVGLSLPAAKEILEDAGFATNVKLSGNETAVVTSQKPAGGSEAEKGSSVTLSYEKSAASKNQSEHTTSSTGSGSSPSHSQPTTPAVSSSESQQQNVQPVQPVQAVSASITSCSKSLIRFTTSGGNATIYVEFIYPSGEHSSRFSLGSYSDGTHEFSPGVSITDPQGVYQVHLYDSNGTLLDTSSFTNN